MIIKLQPDQVPLFWDLIRHGVINAYKIPKEFQQDFVINYLKNLLSGMYQCWVGYEVKDGVKKLTAIQCTRIVDEKEYGIKTLALIGIYGYRLIPEEMIKEVSEALEEFAKSNGCNVMVTEYSSKRVENILNQMGFEKHITVIRKVLT